MNVFKSGISSVAVMVIISVYASMASGENAITVASRSVAAGATSVKIPIYAVNDHAAQAISLPLEIRKVSGGAFMTRAAMSTSGRADTTFNVIRITNQYADKGYSCGGTAASAYGGYPEYSQPDTMCDVTAAPWCMMFAFYKYGGEFGLQPGSDSIASFSLVVDIGDSVGSFEIDTVCQAPYNHVGYIYYDQQGAAYWEVPQFTKGTITVGECDCSHHGDLNDDEQIDASDFNALIDWVFYSIGPPLTDSTCTHIDRGDLNCDGADDALDINYLSDYLFFSGPPPCDPCTCDPYPSSCP